MVDNPEYFSIGTIRCKFLHSKSLIFSSFEVYSQKKTVADFCLLLRKRPQTRNCRRVDSISLTHYAYHLALEHFLKKLIIWAFAPCFLMWSLVIFLQAECLRGVCISPKGVSAQREICIRTDTIVRQALAYAACRFAFWWLTTPWAIWSCWHDPPNWGMYPLFTFKQNNSWSKLHAAQRQTIGILPVPRACIHFTHMIRKWF